jgi:uncharacterized surface protein with fasciclin (FAS1) repeats
VPPTTVPPTTVPPTTAPPTTVPPTTAPPTTEPPTAPADSTVYDVLVANPDQFGTLVTLIDRVGLDADLSTPGASFTIFAPTNTALDDVDLTGASDDEVRDLLLHHVAAESIDAATLFTQSGDLDTLNGTLTIDADTLTIDGASIVFPDLQATGDPNGYVQGIDRVLVP